MVSKKELNIISSNILMQFPNKNYIYLLVLCVPRDNFGESVLCIFVDPKNQTKTAKFSDKWLDLGGQLTSPQKNFLRTRILGW